jgi:hypothetical protein
MWKIIKQVYNYIFRIFLAITIIMFLIVIVSTLFNKELLTDAKLINQIALYGILFSIPGLATQLAHEVNPKKKRFKMTCECPNCKQLIRASMEED